MLHVIRKENIVGDRPVNMVLFNCGFPDRSVNLSKISDVIVSWLFYQLIDEIEVRIDNDFPAVRARFQNTNFTVDATADCRSDSSVIEARQRSRFPLGL